MLHDTNNKSLYFADDALLSAVFAERGCPYSRQYHLKIFHQPGELQTSSVWNKLY